MLIPALPLPILPAPPPPPLLLRMLGEVEPMLLPLLLPTPNCDDMVAADIVEVDCGCKRSGGVTWKERLLLLLPLSSALLTCSSSIPVDAGPLRDPRYFVDDSCGDLFVGVSAEGDGVGEAEDMQSTPLVSLFSLVRSRDGVERRTREENE